MIDKEKQGLVEEIDSLKNRIEELEKLYEELKKQQQHIKPFETVVRDSNDAIIMQDINGQIFAWNKGAEKIYGYKEKEALGMNIEHLVAENKIAEFKDFTRRMIAGEEIPSFETQRVTKDGSILDVWLTMTKIEERLGGTVVSTNRDITMPIGVAMIERNISERKKAEENLRESENKYRTLIEQVPEKIFHKDRNSVYVSCNENFARSFKIRSDEFIGKTDFDFFPKELAEKYRTDDKRIMESGKTEEIEEKYILDGKEAFACTRKTALRNEKGDIIGIIGTFWDISERRKTEEELHKRLQELEVFYKASVGREERILELKKQVAELEEKLNRIQK